MTKTQFTAGAAALMAVVYLGLSAYVIANQSIEELLLCTDTGGLRVPFSKELCRNYLFAFRGTPKDIEALHLGIGASFVVQGQSSESEREEILKFLVAEGLDVNHGDTHGLTPLHGAVLANSASEVEMLLRSGANPRLKDEKFGLSSLELALTLQSEGKPADRQAVIARLRDAN